MGQIQIAAGRGRLTAPHALHLGANRQHGGKAFVAEGGIELLNTLAAKEAFGRAAEPWEVANVIVFLASDYSSYMTGEVVSVSAQRA